MTSSDTGYGIGRAGPGSHQDDARLTGRTRIAISRMGRALLMAHQDMLYILLLVEHVINMQHGSTRVTEEIFNPFFLQATDQNFCAGEFHT
jgi:hypothetical protein